ncbi:integrase family protein [Massilia sp. YMA4]|uniref:tyrosine-type recombinase/integrase n=1 Tax=Massilia sp. YMA4 TaxID=1593482 RepID=UPI000DD17060|nr:integrase family protein [Massilia sp. YMA4]AXA94155.1 preprotein translocase [Massilia sp. YMA4]
MAKVKFTSGRIDSFRCPDGTEQAFLWDSTAPGLGIRVTASGQKAYVFQSKFQNKTIRITIGSPSAWDLSAAQAEARRLKVAVDAGIDPRVQKAELMAEQTAKHEASTRAEMPASIAWDAYLVARAPRWSARTLLDHQRLIAPGGKVKTRGRKKGEGETTLPGVLVDVLARPLRDINSDFVRAWLHEESHRSTVAMNAFVRLRAFLNWCTERAEYKAEVNVDACASRVAKDELPKSSAKDDCLQREQLKSWFDQVRSLPNKIVSAYLQALLLTGARREELAGLRWSDIDFRWNTLTIEDKVESTRTIPLTPYVASLLRSLPVSNEWVFSSTKSASGRIQEPRKAHNQALAAADIPHVSIHGLRRSFGTLTEWVECPTGVVAQIMGHKPSAIAEKHYKRRPIDLLRMWHTKIEVWMLEQAGVENPAAAVMEEVRAAA